ncbi:hypothetical protein NQ314_002329 [Rhamnusium bicolor]|uniref:B9 domain-containing protein 2 n=1 Tax=Rhamnusium bicolor TaxID=1586634 RepID=A0AAV8ZSU0_9CUCU|nr:hypothetical protein NQ314_002329 [Rhamnusium bicolor]
MAEVHIIGQINQAKDFPKQHLFCKWHLHIGWPKIYIEVYHLDWLGRAHLFGYGLITVPTSPGSHILDCYTWRPFGSLRERFTQYFLGGGLQLKYPDLIFSSGERYKLSTEAMGVISLELSVILRNFTNYGVEYH